MTGSVRVFVNDTPLLVPTDAQVWQAICSFDPALSPRLDAGEAFVTDGRGVRLPLHGAVEAGSIIRVVVSARRPAPEIDGHP